MLNSFLNPRTVGIIGATDDSVKVGFSLMDNLFRFQGKIIPINPGRDRVYGLRAYKSVMDYPKKIGLGIIAVPNVFVPKVLRQCGKKGMKTLIVISAGFSEIGNKDKEEELLKIAKRYKIRLLGPNCFGVSNPYNNLNATFGKVMPKKGDIAFVSQSGALWSYVSELGIGFSSYVSLGNMADLGFHDFIKYFADDKKTKSIVLYMEKLKDGKKFLEACKNCKKKIYVVKAGKSEEGEEAALSHTGSLATDYEVYKGAFKQGNVVLCDSLLGAFEKASGKKFKRKKQKLRLGKKVTVITNAGGAGALAADYLSNNGVGVKKIDDIIGTARAEDYRKAIRKYKGQLIVILTPQYMTDVGEIASVIVKSKRKPICLFLGKKSVKEASKILEKNKIRVFNSLDEFRLSL